MAEVKPTTKKTGTNKPVEKPVKISALDSSEVGDLFQNIRGAFVDTIKRLTGYQKEFEKIVSDYYEKGSKYKEDISKIVNVWFNALQKVQEDLSGIVKVTFNTYMPSNINLPFAVEYEKMVLQIQDMLKKFFSAFPVFQR